MYVTLEQIIFMCIIIHVSYYLLILKFSFYVCSKLTMIIMNDDSIVYGVELVYSHQK